MVDKLIRGKILEITLAIVFVLISIPVWQTFEEKISSAEITTLDDYNVTFNVINKNGIDTITVDNDYYINKNYKIYLIVNKKIDNSTSTITINNIEFKLDDFYLIKEKNKYIYVLVDDYIIASVSSYDIRLDFLEKSVDYSYMFEEKSVF